jgi:hypothetical protein
VNILLNINLCYYAEVDGIIFHLPHTRLGLPPSQVSSWKKPIDWKDQYPFWVWAILEE